MIDAVAFFLAAVRAIAPHRAGGPVARSGEELLELIASGRAVEVIFETLTAAEREDLGLLLDRMVRESASFAGRLDVS